MSLPTIKGVEPPDPVELDSFGLKFPAMARWLRILTGAMPRVRTYQPTIDPASVSANSESQQTFTVTGLKTNDVVFVNKPSNTGGIGIINAYVSATDTLAIKFYNTSAGSVNPPSETYRVVAVRL